MNGDIRRVLKAPTQPILDLATLQEHLPLYASDKEDGIRCIIHPRLGAVSQKLLPIPNNWIRNILNANCPQIAHLDGELIALDCEGNDCDFNDTQSAIMSQDGQPSFQFRVFDDFSNQYDPYHQRLITARVKVQEYQDQTRDKCISWLLQIYCKTIKEIEDIEGIALRRGKEGIMLRSPDGWYKEGRSTLREAYLLKVKRFQDDEAVVIGLEEEMENCNAATQDAGGLQKRSKHQAGMKGKGCVGAFICLWKGKEIRIASGLTQNQKNLWWQNPEQIIRQKISFKYQQHGMKDLPRCPVFKGIRYD